MSKKYQTKASKAEQKVIELLKSEKNVIRQWGLVAYDVESRTLQTAASEASIIFSNHANVRPGFEIKNNTVFIPNLFIKISGKEEELTLFYHKEELEKRQNCFIYSSFEDFCTEQAINRDISSYIDDNGKVDMERLPNSDLFPYSFLRREYQNLLISKINECLKGKNSFFNPGLSSEDDIYMLSYLLSIDKNLMEAYNRFDFQFQPPSVIIFSAQKEKMRPYHGLQLILLNKLGFDIIIVSPEGYSDIENIINSDYYCIYYGDPEKKPGKKNKNYYYALTGAALLISAAILINPVQLYSTYLRNNAVDKIISDTANKVGHDLAVGVGFSNNNAVPVVNLSVGADNSSKELGNTETVVTFRESSLEAVIRKLANKMDGTVTLGDLDKLNNIYLVGIYSGSNDWNFVNGYSPQGYMDNEGINHTEEGYYNDLSDLRHLRGLQRLSVNWQKQLDISTLNCSNTLKSLTLIHDHIRSADGLSCFNALTELNLSYNEIHDLKPLSKNADLRCLDLQCNNIEDISILSGFTDLNYLVLSSNPIRDVSALQGLSKLKILSVMDTPISDFSFLNELCDLENLILGKTQFSDLSDIKNLKALKYLDISHTNVTDISILKELPSLQQVCMYGVKLKDTSILKDLREVTIEW